jgi:DinB superfamily
MSHNLDNSIALLSRTPATLDALLRDMPDAWTRATEGPDSWSPFDVVAHLIHCDRTNWMQRARTIREHGETRPFDPFDRTGHLREIEGKSLPQVLDELARIRSANLQELIGWDLTPADLACCGRHPKFGAVSMSELLATWVTHDLTHLHQISRVLAHQYRDTVGPFRVFLGVLQCEGHSAAS